ncbi:MAG: cation:proton antiporter [Candidatus Thermoplasmatota archaeon]|nr:cation:proton antiporter [Candidatus Thermoplasmatota archaeon]
MFSVALALLFARVLGFIFDKLKQPAVIGEIIAGLVLGIISLHIFFGQNYTFFNITVTFPNLAFNTPEFELLAEFGILFLLFVSGLETRISKIREMGKSSTFVAIGGIIVPLMLGIITGIMFNFSIQESIVIGLILIATSVGVTVRSLLDLHVLDTNVGNTILGAAVIDDILGIILLAFIFGIASPLWVGFKIIIFFIIFLYIGIKLIDKIIDLGEKIHLPKALLSISLSIFLIYSFFADKAGISAIIGAFVAGLLIGQTVRSRKIINDVKTMGYGFFIPLFFVWVGTIINIKSFLTIGLFTFIIIVIAIFGKIIGCGLSAKISGLNLRESIQVGIGMIPRMEVALIIATYAIANNIIIGNAADQILATTLILTIITTIITPYLIKKSFKI